MTLEEAILNRVRELPPEKQEELLRFADKLHEPRTVAPINHRYKEMEWIAANRCQYIGQWVALDGDRLIAADPDAMKVYQAAKAEGIETPFLHHMLPKNSLPFVGGW
jgi:hypothetical protein